MNVVAPLSMTHSHKHSQPKKTNRRRCRPTTYGGGLGSGGEEGESRRKKMTYPPEFPVGKTVFLENDRRRACWLPAVVSDQTHLCSYQQPV